MTALLSLWMPILVSAVLVFIASAIIRMLLGYHNNDWVAVPDEDAFRRAVGPLGLPPGDYSVPRCSSMKEMNSPEYQAKLDAGPVLMMTVMPNGQFHMGKSLVLWLLHCALVAAFAAWVVGNALPADAASARVFCVAAVVAFAGFGLAEIPHSIWYNRRWATTAREVFDALVFALITGAVFAWLTPAA